MTKALATTNIATPPALNVPEHGDFQVEPFSTDRITVKTDSLLVKGMLYQFSGQMMKHSSGDWYFLQETINCPKLSPKLKEETLLRIAEQARAYMMDHPEVMDILAVRSWEKDLSTADHQISGAEYQLVQTQRYLENYRARMHEEQQEATTAQAKLDALLQHPPKGATLPAAVTVRSRYFKKLLMQKEADAWTPDDQPINSSSPS